MYRDSDGIIDGGQTDVRRAYDRTCLDLAHARKHDLPHEATRLTRLKSALEEHIAGSWEEQR